MESQVVLSKIFFTILSGIKANLILYCSAGATNVDLSIFFLFGKKQESHKRLKGFDTATYASGKTSSSHLIGLRAQLKNSFH